jgi:hypothetical protein
LRGLLDRHLVVVGVALAIDEEPVVVWIEHRYALVVSGERPNGVHRLPERDHQELRSVPVDPSEHEDTAVPRCSAGSFTPVSRRYSTYGSTSRDLVQPRHVRAIIVVLPFEGD